MGVSKVEAIQDQIIGNVADIVNKIRVNEMEKAISNQGENFNKAVEYVNNLRLFMNNPENILGSDKTKFGEIAEQIEVNIRNANDALKGKITTATFEGVGRTAPEDYIIDRNQVQSKFINGINNNLRYVLEHMDKYKGFSHDGYYHIPKDNFEILNKINNGEQLDGVSQKTIDAAKRLINKIEEESGKSFNEVVKPGISTYKEVQKGAVNETVNKHENRLKKESDDMKKDIIAEHQPSVQEGIKVGVIGAVIGGGFKAAGSIYKKCRVEEKKISDFTGDDWKDVGVDFATGGVKGGINGIAIYGLTNFTDVGAPLASAFVSATWGVSSLIAQYKNGNLTIDELSEQGQILCLETGAVALGSIIGQTLIPIPIVGTLIGSFAAQTLMSITKGQLGKKEIELEQKLLKEYNEAIDNLEKNYKVMIDKIIAEYERLGGLIDMAFDFKSNAVFRLEASVNLAIDLGVSENEILENIDDIDSFFLN